MMTIISPAGQYSRISTGLLRHIATRTRTKRHGHHLNPPLGLLSPYSVLSTVHRGTAFERCSRALLSQHMSMTLTRVGGKEDGGVDLQGWWWLPPPSSLSSDARAMSSNTAVGPGRPRPRRIRVLAQCKAEKKSLGPNYVREMEGVMYRILSAAAAGSRSGPLASAGTGLGALPTQISANAEPCSADVTNLDHTTETASTNTTATVGMIISSSPFGKSALLRAMSSPVPLFLLQLPFDVSAESSFSSEVVSDAISDVSPSSDFVAAFWNAALAKGVLRDEFEVRLEHAPSAGEDRIRLWWNGERLGNYVPSDSGLVSP